MEVLPGGGWYTEIPAPLLRDEGRLVEANPPTISPNAFMRRMAAMSPATWGYVSCRRNTLIAMPKSVAPMTSRAIVCGQSSAIPAPLRNTPSITSM